MEKYATSSEFVPSWMKPKPVAPAAPAPPPRAPQQPQAQAPPSQLHGGAQEYKPKFTTTNTASNRSTKLEPQSSPAFVPKGTNAALPAAGGPPPRASPHISFTAGMPATPDTTPKRRYVDATSSANNTPLITPKTPNLGKVLEGVDLEVIRKIAQTSSMKATAASFVPTGRTLKASMALSPISLAPQDDDGNMQLTDNWTLYFLPSPPGKGEPFDPALVFGIDTVASFWKTMNNLPEAEELPARSSMYLFRDDIVPKWEDPQNKDGGLYRVAVSSRVANDVWLRTAARTIGESWKRLYRDNVNGIVLKVKEKGMYIEVWVKRMIKTADGKDEFRNEWHSAFSSIVEIAAIDFYTHQELQSFIQQAAENPAKKQKKKKY